MRYLLLTISLLVNFSFADDLQPSKNEELAMIIGAGEEIFKSDPASTFPVMIRAYTSPTYIGECWGKIESCPDIRLFITVFDGGLYEIPKLYELPKEKGWKFISRKMPNKSTVVIEFSTTLPGANIEPEFREQWTSKKYVVTITDKVSYKVEPNA